jgi:hypothetical protein
MRVTATTTPTAATPSATNPGGTTPGPTTPGATSPTAIKPTLPGCMLFASSGSRVDTHPGQKPERVPSRLVAVRNNFALDRGGTAGPLWHMLVAQAGAHKQLAKKLELQVHGPAVKSPKGRHWLGQGNGPEDPVSGLFELVGAPNVP